MVFTPFQDLKSEDILAAHLSGIQHSITKLERVLTMKSGAMAGHDLQPVADQESAELHYRIYEGTVRNWLDSPSPIIYRNGEQVSSSEYEIQPAYGVIIFLEQQTPEDEVTADFEYIIADAEVFDQIGALAPIFQPSGSWRTNTAVAGPTSESILIGANLFDAYPFLVTETSSYNALGIRVDVPATTGTARLGVYKDNGSCYPGERMVDAGTLPVTETGVKTAEINVTLTPGLYWLVRNSNSAPGLSGMAREFTYPIGMDNSLQGAPAGAIRVSQPYGALPDTFPATGELLFRTHYPCVWIRRA
ncbi:hypothetical protein [Bacillus horti]|uniref:Uncharacterized protein n=1 Tax=Caldalkalibacillus horti TaxID=77523 RepID=A0ABT9W5B4_9BACI|nr:hypothetical protein [Bacillus horti]MDQ0168444.1 hypothetical protein [Bacillus horti]